MQFVWAIAQFAEAVNAFPIDSSEIRKSLYCLFEFSPSTKVTAPLIIVDGGCNKLGFRVYSTDYRADLAGKIAITARETCNYGIKLALAGSVGDSGTILYNINDEGPMKETLLPPSHPPTLTRFHGPYIPTLNIIKSVFEPIVAALRCRENVIASFDMLTDIRNLILGAHTDFVIAGSGINDDGSGLAALFEVARALSRFTINNAVIFAFWTAEELYQHPGLSKFLQILSVAEKATIRAYLNFDMDQNRIKLSSFHVISGLFHPTTSMLSSTATAAGQNYTTAQFNGRFDL
ncbi:hypothetical protein COCC4DRAFT_91112, partial [Bipolaris maydis ATCC 48331]|uniref:Peptide hydrolase n=2 Tax=Cochliobolus heterostrophus TaxID=5016 RepID=M2UVG2_COCH5